MIFPASRSAGGRGFVVEVVGGCMLPEKTARTGLSTARGEQGSRQEGARRGGAGLAIGAGRPARCRFGSPRASRRERGNGNSADGASKRGVLMGVPDGDWLMGTG
ncbi:MAG: hypothetical protein Tsb0032_17810 [Kiloniellaceae bacterium]